MGPPASGPTIRAAFCLELRLAFPTEHAVGLKHFCLLQVRR